VKGGVWWKMPLGYLKKNSKMQATLAHFCDGMVFFFPGTFYSNACGD